MEVYINHVDESKDFKIRFANLDNMHLYERLVTPFDMKIDNKGYAYDLNDLIEMHVNLEAKVFLKSKNLA